MSGLAAVAKSDTEWARTFSSPSPELLSIFSQIELRVEGLGFRVSGLGFKCKVSQMVVSQNSGYPFGGPYNKDYSILGSILGPLI